jgi:hypothetical protein
LQLFPSLGCDELCECVLHDMWGRLVINCECLNIKVAFVLGWGGVGESGFNWLHRGEKNVAIIICVCSWLVSNKF